MTDIEPRLRDALQPGQHERDVAEHLVEHALSGNGVRRGATAMGDPKAKRPRWVIPAVAASCAAAVVVGVVAVSGVFSRPEAPVVAAPPPRATETLVVTCGPNKAISLSTDRVAAASDGVHVRVENRTGGPVKITEELEPVADESQAGSGAYQSTLTMTYDHKAPGASTNILLTSAPGRLALTCGGKPQAAVTVTDPNAYYRGGSGPYVCDGQGGAVDSDLYSDGDTPELALSNLAQKISGRGKSAAIAKLGYRDSPTSSALIFKPKGITWRVSVSGPRAPRSPTPSKSGSTKKSAPAYSAGADSFCTTTIRPATPFVEPKSDEVVRAGVPLCKEAAIFDSLEPPLAFGPTPQQAAEALTHFQTGQVRAVAKYPDSSAGTSDETWAMEVDGKVIQTIRVHTTTAAQKAFGQGFEALPYTVCDSERFISMLKKR